MVLQLKGAEEEPGSTTSVLLLIYSKYGIWLSVFIHHDTRVATVLQNIVLTKFLCPGSIVTTPFRLSINKHLKRIVVSVQLTKIHTKGNSKCLSIWRHRDFYYLLGEDIINRVLLGTQFGRFFFIQIQYYETIKQCCSQLLSHMK